MEKNALSMTNPLIGRRIGCSVGFSLILDKMREPSVVHVSPRFFVRPDAGDRRRESGPAVNVSSYRHECDAIYEWLCQGFEVTRPQGAFYIMPRVEAADCDAYAERPLAHNALIVPGSAFSLRRTHVRLSFATSLEKIQRGVEVLISVAD